VIFARAPGRYPSRRDPDAQRIALRFVKSEAFAPSVVGKVLCDGHFANTTTGIWLYEAGLLYPDLRERLVADLRLLADAVESGEISTLYARERVKERP
jgi:hypothetical protein